MRSGAPPMEGISTGPADRAVGLWLLVCCAMVAVMVVLGGATRLTDSGLSIVDWRPVTGVLPPMTDADWQTLFDAYRRTPEFQRANFWMTVADFKTIYWLEYLHRLWGRLIGVAFLAPFLWFLARGRVRGGFAWRLGGAFLLGGLQGLLGWYMVKSGLVNRTDVSQYRLAAHLAFAFVIHGWLLWLALRCLSPSTGRERPAPLRGHAVAVAAGALVTVVAGAFVAGIDAGLAYNTFPLMDGQLAPPGAWLLDPWWLNFFENTATVQFTHRVLGTLLVAAVLWLWLRARTAVLPPATRKLLDALAVMALAQMALGIATLLTAVALPLAVLHQAGALALFTLALWAVYALGAGPPAADE
jgi:cytochrome c oxidase assembly protein subunit 15